LGKKEKKQKKEKKRKINVGGKKEKKTEIQNKKINKQKKKKKKACGVGKVRNMWLLQENILACGVAFRVLVNKNTCNRAMVSKVKN